MAPTGRGTHPRPQLIRPHWLDLSGSWQFRADDADRGRSEKWSEGSGEAFDRTIVVPFPPESPASGIGRRGHHPVPDRPPLRLSPLRAPSPSG